MAPTLVTTTGELIKPGGGPYQLTRTGRESLSRPSVPLAQWGSSHMALLGGATISYGALYRSQPWAHIVINKLTRAISRLPLKVYERNSQGAKIRVRDGRLYDLINQPAPRKGPVHFKQWLTLSTLIHGNSVLGYYRPEKGGPPAKVWPLDFRFLAPHSFYEGGPIDAWESTEFGDRVFIASEDCLHVAWEPPDGRVGVSPLQALGITVRLEDAAQRYQSASFANASRPSGVVTTPKETVLDRTERREMREDLRMMHEGIDNAFRVGLLTGGADWKPMSFSAVDAELIEQRKLSREEIAAAYDLPPPLIGILDKATFSNIETQARLLYTDVLGPWLALIEDTIMAQLVNPEPAFEGQFVEFDLNEVLRGDPEKRSKALKTQIESGVLTINEARDLENRPRYEHEDADKPLIPVNNLAPIGTPRSNGSDPDGSKPDDDDKPDDDE